MTINEQQTCPRRVECGPWEKGELLDSWKTDRWNADIEDQKKRNSEEIARHEAKYGTGSLHLSPTCDMWLWNWGPPRSCSFCGSVHPEDALRLIGEGWEFEIAKPYKLYINPPGTNVRLAAALASIRNDRIVVPSVWSPVPPVKLYMMHCNDAQFAEFKRMAESRSGDER